MISLVIIAALIGAFLIAFSIKPIYGIAFLIAFRTLSLLVAVPIGAYQYSAEGFLTLTVILVGLIYLLTHRKGLDGFTKWPFVVFILYCALTFIVAEDTANFLKKLARLVGYFITYLMIAQLSLSQKNRRILTFAFILSILVTDLPAVYLYYIAPEKYMRLLYATDAGTGLQEVGFMSKNNFGFFCCYMVSFLICLYTAARSGFSRALLLALFVMQAALLVLSYTRAAWISFIVAVPVLLFYLRNKTRLLLPALAALLIGVSLFSVIQYGAYKELTQKRQYGFSSWHFRVAYAWPASLRAFERKPVLGWGLGNDLYALTHGAKLNATSHNDYLLVLVETGAIGLFLYLSLLFALFRRTTSGMHSIDDYESRVICVAALAIFVSFLVGSAGEHLLQTPGATGYVITILGMAHGTIRAGGSRTLSENRGIRRNSRGPRYRIRVARAERSRAHANT